MFTRSMSHLTMIYSRAFTYLDVRTDLLIQCDGNVGTPSRAAFLITSYIVPRGPPGGIAPVVFEPFTFYLSDRLGSLVGYVVLSPYPAASAIHLDRAD